MKVGEELARKWSSPEKAVWAGHLSLSQRSQPAGKMGGGNSPVWLRIHRFDDGGQRGEGEWRYPFYNMVLRAVYPRELREQGRSKSLISLAFICTVIFDF